MFSESIDKNGIFKLVFHLCSLFSPSMICKIQKNFWQMQVLEQAFNYAEK